MTREEIREGIENWFLMRNPDKTRNWAEWETKMLFIKQDELGVVIKVDRELPFVGWNIDERRGFLKAIEAGYVAVEPLIKEE